VKKPNNEYTREVWAWLDMDFTKKRQIRMYEKFVIDGFQEKNTNQ